MIQAPVWIIVGVLRASAGLAIAAVAVAACVRLLQLRAPKTEQWAWMIVMTQGIILFPVAIPVPTGIWGPGMAPRHEQTAVVSSQSPRAHQEALRGTPGRDVDNVPAREPAPLTELPSERTVAVRRPWDDVTVSWPLVALTAWLAGIGVLLSMGYLRYRSFADRLRASRRADPEWHAQWRQVLDEQAIRGPIHLLVSRETGPALCWSWAGYRLVVPESLWTALSTNERTVILRHELEHYRRGDLWVALLARGLAVLHWFNPLAWWAVARFEAQSEFICDRASSVDDPAAFAAMLLRLGSARRERVATALSAGSGSLCERIQRLLADAPQPARWKCALPVAVAIVALGIMAVRFRAVRATEASLEPSSGQAGANGRQTPLPLHALLRIGTDLMRAPGNIRSFALSPGGQLVAAGDLNAPSPRITIFDLRSGRRVKQLLAPENRPGWVETVAFSPDGTKLLWGEESGEVALWDLSTDRLLFRRTLHQGNVAAEVFSPDGRLFASGGYDGVIRLRRVEKPEESLWDVRIGRLSNLAFTPDGRRLVAANSFSRMIGVWDANDGRLLREIGPTAGDLLKSMVVTPDSRHIITAGNHEEGEGAEKRRENLRLEDPRDVLRALDALQAAGPMQPTVKRTEIWLWDIATGEQVRDLNRPEEIGFGDVALSPDGRRMAIVNFGGLRMLDASTLGPRWAVDLPGWWGRPVAFSSDGKLVAVPEQNTVAIFEATTGRRLHHDESTPVGRVGAVAWSPSGDRIVTGHSDGYVRVWDAATGKLIRPRRLAPIVRPGDPAAAPNFVGFSRNGKLLLAAGHRDPASETGKGIVVVYDAATGEVAREIPRGWIRLAAPAPDGRLVVVANDNSVAGIEAMTGRPRWSTPTVNKPDTYVQPAALQFEANPPWFDVALKDGTVIRFNVLTGHEQRRFFADGRTPEQRVAARPGNEVLSAAAFSADGRTMASFSPGWISLWDVEAGMLRRRIRYPASEACLLALAPDGKTVAATGVRSEEDFGEVTIRLYDSETGDSVLTLEPADDRADVLAFSPDGTRLLTGSQRGSVVVWDVHTRQRER
jgi:WD40 repeat protein/beta-lactamase regulating signal transducer with metallopeptidase domain